MITAQVRKGGVLIRSAGRGRRRERNRGDERGSTRAGTALLPRPWTLALVRDAAAGANATGAKSVAPRAPGPRYFLGPGPSLW